MLAATGGDLSWAAPESYDAKVDWSIELGERNAKIMFAKADMQLMKLQKVKGW